LDAVNFYGLNLKNWDFSNQSLVGTNLNNTYLGGANFSHARLVNANLSFSNLSNTDFSDADLTGATLSTAEVHNIILARAIIKNVDFTLATVYGDFPPANFYQSASYSFHDLTGIIFDSDNLADWNLSNQDITNASFVDAYLKGTDFSNAIINGTTFFNSNVVNGLNQSQLYSTKSYINNDLRRIVLENENVAGWDFGNKDLTGADFASANLTGTIFKNAVVSRTNFRSTTSLGFTSIQLYVTASYLSGDLSGIGLSSNNLAGWTFAGMNLTSASFADQGFGGATLTNTNFSDTDLRAAIGWTPVASTITTNTIRPDGSINGLALVAGEKLIIRNFPLAITAKTSASFDAASTLQIQLDANWGSQIKFATALTPSLAGTLDLELASTADPASLVGTTFQLFIWNSPPASANHFTNITSDPALTFDTSKLYTLGTVTLTAAAPIPEPTTLLLLTLTLSVLFRRPRSRRTSTI
jgi:uncharacterized protein YjbI with pentapeptide repeats